MSFTHLHVHSVHSLSHSALKVEDSVDEAIRLGMKALAITDYDSIYAAHELALYARTVAEDFKTIVGCEMHVAPVLDLEKKSLLQKAPHLTVLCKNATGYQNLCKLLEMAWNEGFHFCPTVTFEWLEEHKDGLIVLSGCPGCEVAKHFLAGNLKAAEDVVLQYHRVSQDDYYLELVRNGFDDKLENDYTRFLMEIGKKYGIKVVATNDVHRCKKSDEETLKCLAKANIGEFANTIPFPSNDWFKSEAEMLERFSGCPEAIRTTAEITNKIEVYSIPKWNVPAKDWNEKDYMADLQMCLDRTRLDL